MESSEEKEQISRTVRTTTKPLPSDERSVLYEKGLEFKRNASYSHALQCFLGCIQGINNVNFPELPHCLRNIAETYSTLGEFEKAIEFVQAEKLFYETALIQAGREELNDPNKDKKQNDLLDPNANSEDAKLANEYDKLAQMCLKEKKIQLALEYSGKATQLRKKIYGDAHPITSKSLNQFTLIYAEMGKEQYTAAMEQFSKKNKSDEVSTAHQSKKPDEKISDQDDSSEEKSSENQTKEGKEETETINKPKVSSENAIFVYFLVTLIASLVLTAVVCYITRTDIRAIHSYVLQKLRFYYYYYFGSSVHGVRYI